MSVAATTAGKRILVFNGSLFASFGRSGKEKVHFRKIVHESHAPERLGKRHHVHKAVMLKNFSNCLESKAGNWPHLYQTLNAQSISTVHQWLLDIARSDAEARTAPAQGLPFSQGVLAWHY